MSAKLIKCTACAAELHSGYMTNRHGSFCGSDCALIWATETIEGLESAKVELVDYIDEVLTLVEIYEGPSERGDALIAKHTPPEGENK